jgi:hypothetical protein
MFNLKNLISTYDEEYSMKNGKIMRFLEGKKKTL